MAELTQLGTVPTVRCASRKRVQAGSRHAQGRAKDPRSVCTRGREGGLRLGVLGGGCSGLSYQFKFAAGADAANDHVFEFEDVRVFVDPKSMVFLDGMTLDWQDSLIQSGFVFQIRMRQRAVAAVHPSRPKRMACRAAMLATVHALSAYLPETHTASENSLAIFSKS